MFAVAGRSIYRLVRCVTCSSTPTNRPIVLHFRHNNTPARRYLNAIASSVVPFSNTDQAGSSGTSGFNVDSTVEEDIVATNNVQDENITTHASLPFKSLEDRVSHHTLKSLTVDPLQLKTMTPVQERVTALLPNLACPWDPEGIVPPHVPTALSSDWKSPVVDWDAPRDILVRAKTGTGKTFAYIIPAIESRLNYVEHSAKLVVINAGLENSPRIAGSARLAYRRRSAGPLILAPTRELAIQIASDAQKLTTHQRDFEVQLLVGGAGKTRQMKDWMGSSRDLVVATPGRLRDLLTNEPEFRQGFKGCPMLILDEADTLLSMGFRDDVDAIVSFLPRPPVRQTFLFSATMPRAVRQLASWILSPNHTFIDAVPPESGSTPGQNEEHTAHTELAVPCDDELATHDHIEQFHTLCPTASDQLPTLLKLLAHDQLTHGSSSKVIVFCPTVQTTELFSMLLRSLVEEVLPNDTTEIVTMHSKMRQSDRDRTRVLFHKAGKTRNGKPTVLVSSDVSARGVDYPGVTRVIQIGIPSKETMYIHRVGRMARGADSFAPGKGKEADRPAVRADLLLLPWEAGYMNWQLTTLPIKPLPTSVLDSQLSLRSSTLNTEFLKSVLAEIRHRIDPTDIRRTAASLLGYYLPLSPSLRLQPTAILAGVSSWATESFNVSIPAITRFPRKFTEAYVQSTQSKETKGLFVDGLRVAGPSLVGTAKSRNRSVWEGANTRRKKPRRWH
ncbi:P-loop containing nucleoside triphosphate hydrolase protein [Boletus coccyginus]|nr:P-loop containing nucleoside triphosphate hydrolase protein [Boletus coccyginus]KAI9568133.1 P-loop containing nucleoside triphosphate hydrolase protein [Boletus coccyginus]